MQQDQKPDQTAEYCLGGEQKQLSVHIDGPALWQTVAPLQQLPSFCGARQQDRKISLLSLHQHQSNF
jgi:hypothetical protein